MFVTVNGKAIHFTQTGSGAPILLVHGWGGTGRSLQQLAGFLSGKYRVLTVDLPGFGSSDNPEPSWGVKEYAAILTGFLDNKVRAPVTYFGHSFGGALGVYIAATNPGHISKLILAAASFHRIPHRKNHTTTLIGKLPLPHLAKLTLRKILYKVFFPRSDILNYPHLEQNYRNIVKEDLTPLLHRIMQPSLILWGERDLDTPLADARLLQERIKRSRLVVFPHASHGFPLKNAADVYREMDKFI